MRVFSPAVLGLISMIQIQGGLWAEVLQVGGDVVSGFTTFPIGIFCWFHSALIRPNGPDTTDRRLYIARTIAT